MLALPGLKLGWMGLTGDRDRIQMALKALEGISDTFLPVSELVQAAVPALIKSTSAFQTKFVQTIRERALWAMGALHALKSIQFTPADGGFYTALRLPDGWDDDQSAVALLREKRILVHPGHFYDLEEPYWVVSHIHPAQAMAEAIRRMAEFTERRR